MNIRSFLQITTFDIYSAPFFIRFLSLASDYTQDLAHYILFGLAFESQCLAILFRLQ
jgi:hypothetical protein